MKLIFDVNDSPLALVMVTHSREAAEMCDRTLHLSDGGITEK
jgi:ABC-type lipoprotein export system ATPase subunit